MTSALARAGHALGALRAIPEAYQVPRIPASGVRFFFDEFYCQDRPVIITGALRDWPCFRTWTPEYLKGALGQRQHVFRYEEGQSLSMDVADYLDVAFSKKTPAEYASALPTPPSATEKLPYMRHFGPLRGPLLAEYEIASLFPEPEAFRFSTFLFCGVPSTKTNCHYDWTHNFVGVVRGRKHVTLLPPGAERHMAVSDEQRGMLAKGDCDFFADPPGLELRPEAWGAGGGGLPMHEHPVFKGCPELSYSPLDEGDLVFFPAYWYHYFHNIEPSISVTTQTCPIGG
ncbi:MAG TPA: cupin-like domain-containing protein [Polyangiaceae bacterium]|nr:cupin-like domain-containing protein [Polyangiaceae bacterium]